MYTSSSNITATESKATGFRGEVDTGEPASGINTSHKCETLEVQGVYYKGPVENPQLVAFDEPDVQSGKIEKRTSGKTCQLTHTFWG